MTPTQEERERLTSIFRYLQELVQLRSRVVFDVVDYEEVIWLSEMPQSGSIEINTSARDGAPWLLRVSKPRVPNRPEPSSRIREWIDTSTLDSIEDMPDIRSELPANGRTDDDRPRSLIDDDVAEGLVNAYLEEWMAWRDAYVPAKAAADVYDRIHSLYLQMKREAQTFELVAVSALISLADTDKGAIRRHLLAIPVSIEFSAARGVLTVSPESDLAQCRLETDMIPLRVKPEQQVEQELEAAANGLTTQIWDEPSVLSVVKPYINERSEREYDANAERPSAANARFITFAPAMLLRRRGERDVLRLLGEIGHLIQSTDGVPAPLINLVRSVTTGISEGTANVSEEQPDVIPLFPKPSNQEQRAILRDLAVHDLVRVQGPPGTGKSHTIANVVCHLLATGCRVLVTSQSPGALKVLKGQLPDGLKPLCVNLLGNDQESRDDLERSVGGIDAGLDDEQIATRLVELPAAIMETERLSKDLQSTQADLYGKLNLEALGIGPLFDRYHGSPGDIAQQLDGEREEIGWITDEPSLGQAEPVNKEEAMRFLGLTRQNRLESIEPDERSLVRRIKLPAKEELIQWIKVLNDADTSINRLAADDKRVVIALARLCADELATLSSELSHLIQTAVALPLDEQPWVGPALRSFTIGRAEMWTHLGAFTESTCQSLGTTKPPSIHRALSPHSIQERVIHDVRRRISALRAKPGWLSRLTSQDLRETKYLGQWSVDGAPCSDEESLGTLLIWLEAELGVYQWEQEWCEHLVGECSTLSQRIVRVQSYRSVMKAVEEASRHAAEVRKLLVEAGIPDTPHTSLQEVGNLQEASRTASLIGAKRQVLLNISRVTESIDTLPPSLASVGPVGALRAAFEATDLARALMLLDHWDELRKCCKDLDERDALAARLSTVLPNLAVELLSDPHSPAWDARLPNLTAAFQHAQTKTEVLRLCRLGNVDGMWEKECRIRSEMLSAIGGLAAAQAWIKLSTRVGQDARIELRAWGQAARQAARTGKRASAARVRARELMPACQKIVPAWIMPLFKVAEQHTASSTVPYDIAIIDEASQASLWSLILFFLANKVLVVGDEYQTAPETVGIKDEDAADRADRHLGNLPASLQQALTYTNSLYDAVGVTASKRVTLREHFRCMPEIIEYSNRLCYKPNGHPLLPLRQYPPVRLAPIRTTYVPGALREAHGQNAVNKIEAEAIARSVAECCGSLEYAQKKMAVLSLQGKEQSRLIERLVRTKVGPAEIEARDMKFGEPSTLQGDERDVVFISMVAGPGETRISALGKPEDQRRFNVAVSRAKDQVWVFHSMTEDELSTSCYRRKLLAYLREARAGFDHIDGIDAVSLRHQAQTARRELRNQPKPFDSWFEVDVCLQAASNGYRVRPQVAFGNYRVDLIIEGDSTRLAVECDGDHVHGEANWERDARRLADLQRCGLRFWHIRYSEYYVNRNRATESLWRTLDELGILPEGAVSQQPASTATTTPQPDAEVLFEDRVTEYSTSPSTLPLGGLSDGTTAQPDYAECIVSVLKGRPNRTCTEKGLADFVLKVAGKFDLRGRARDEEKLRIHSSLKALTRRQAVERYRNPGENANWRLRLLTWD